MNDLNIVTFTENNKTIKLSYPFYCDKGIDVCIRLEDLREKSIQSTLKELNAYCELYNLNKFTLNDLGEIYHFSLSHNCTKKTFCKSVGFTNGKFICNSKNLYMVCPIDNNQFLYQLVRSNVSSISLDKRGTFEGWKQEIKYACNYVEMQVLMCSSVSSLLLEAFNIECQSTAINIISSNNGAIEKISHLVCSVFGNQNVLSKPFETYPAQKNRLFIPTFMTGHRFQKGNCNYPIYIKSKESYTKKWLEKAYQHKTYTELIEIDINKIENFLPALSDENYGTAVRVIANYIIKNKHSLEKLLHEKYEYICGMINRCYKVENIRKYIPQIEVFLKMIDNIIFSCSLWLVSAEIFNRVTKFRWKMEPLEEKILRCAEMSIGKIVSHRHSRLFRIVKRLCNEKGQKLKPVDDNNKGKGCENGDLGYVMLNGRKSNTYSINLYVKSLPRSLRRYFDNVKRTELQNSSYREKHKFVFPISFDDFPVSLWGSCVEGWQEPPENNVKSFRICDEKNNLLSYIPITYRCPIFRFGGKNVLKKFYGYIFNEYLARVNPNSILVTACGGGAREFCYVNKYNFQAGFVYNEVSPIIWSLFDVLADDVLYKKLSKKLKQIHEENLKNDYAKACHYSIKENAYPKRQRITQGLKVMLAYYGFIMGNYSYFGIEGKYMPEVHKTRKKNTARKNDIAEIFHLQCRGWTCKNKDVLQILKEYRCNENAIIFIDPPYITDKVSYELNYYNNVNHSEMVKMLLKEDTQAKIILCGIKSEKCFATYEPLIQSGWRYIPIKNIIVNSSNVNNTKSFQYECMWINFDIPDDELNKALSLT